MSSPKVRGHTRWASLDRHAYMMVLKLFEHQVRERYPLAKTSAIEIWLWRKVLDPIVLKLAFNQTDFWCKLFQRSPPPISLFLTGHVCTCTTSKLRIKVHLIKIFEKNLSGERNHLVVVDLVHKKLRHQILVMNGKLLKLQRWLLFIWLLLFYFVIFALKI